MKSFKLYLLLSLSILSAGQGAFAQERRPGPGQPPGPGRPPGPGHPPGEPGNPGDRPPRQPEPPPGPTGPDQGAIDSARRDGEFDGQRDGESQGRPQGREEGRREGEQNGYREGFNQCERDMREREHDRGVQDGYREGERSGDSDGRRDGDREGDNKGTADGHQDGINRADNDARNAATGPGRDRGYQEANASDAPQRGKADGIVAGDKAAKEEAERTDYPRGRKEYNDERWAEAVGREDEFSQKSTSKSSAAPVPQVKAAALRMNMSMVALPNSSFVITPQRRSYPTQEEQSAYDQGYNWSYSQAYDRARRDGYNETYQDAFRNASSRGCSDAQHRDYSSDYRDGYEDGKRDGYRRAYDRAYNDSYRRAYDDAFRSESQAAYRSNYDNFYKRHFEAARSQAYQERYDELYDQAYRPAYQAKYDAVYPGYAKAAYARGRADETQDFINRPLRLIEVAPTETIVNGVFEPGEASRLQFKVRNFAAAKVEGSRVKIVITPDDKSAAVISEGTSSLVKALEVKSVTTVKEALEFVMNENQVNKTARFKFEVFVDGKLSDTKTLQVKTQFLADVSLDALPDLKEGIPTTVTLKVKNQGNIATDSGLQLELMNQNGILEVHGGPQTVGALAAGTEKRVTFTVISRATGANVTLPVEAVAKTGSGRRVGALSERRQVPIANDYRIEIAAGADKLRTPGIQRIEYRITNISSRQVMSGLQLGVNILGDNADNFVVLGPNPQYLSPMIKGQTVSFVVPVMVKNANREGTVELDVKEDGQTVVIHRRAF